MRIVVDNSAYGLRNLGDVAMLQVAVQRLTELWQGTFVQVITDAPDLLARYCPSANPLSARSRAVNRIINQGLFGAAWNLVPSPASRLLSKLDGMIQSNNSSWHEAVSKADVLVASGGAYINDVFAAKAVNTLRLLSLAIANGTPTAMFGMGIGPIRSQGLLTKAKLVLPQVDLIALREERTGLPFLRALNVSPDRVVTTGDDAIQLAFDNRALELGSGIGVNLRVAPYSKVGRASVESVRRVMEEASDKYSAPLVAVPILIGGAESDVETIRKLIPPEWGDALNRSIPDSPLQVCERLNRCRLMVTGSYHAGLFALAQGLQVVGLAKSEYYVDKFLGLADQFPSGCQVVRLDHDLHGSLLTAIDTAWRLAAEKRSQLLASAKNQIDLSRAAYQRFYDSVEHGHPAARVLTGGI